MKQLVAFVFIMVLTGSTFAEDPAEKEKRVANFAARRTTLIRLMPWDARSDLNYLATLVDHNLLVGAGAERMIYDLGLEFQKLTDEYFRLCAEIKKAEKDQIAQEELDRRMEKRFNEFARKTGEFKRRLTTRIDWVVPESRRWEFVANELFTPQTYGNLQLLANLASNDVLPKEDVAKLDADLRRLNDLSSNMGLESVTPERMSAMTAAHDALLNDLEERINRLYRNLPTSPRWKKWAEEYKK